MGAFGVGLIFPDFPNEGREMAPRGVLTIKAYLEMEGRVDTT
jgi:hypothetical protein